jgi:hypothetical protein
VVKLDCGANHRDQALVLDTPLHRKRVTVETFGFPLGVSMKHAIGRVQTTPRGRIPVLSDFDISTGFSGSPVLLDRTESNARGQASVIGITLENGQTKQCNASLESAKASYSTPADCRALSRRGIPSGFLGGSSCEDTCKCKTIPRCPDNNRPCKYANRMLPSCAFIPTISALHLKGARIADGAVQRCEGARNRSNSTPR